MPDEPERPSPMANRKLVLVAEDEGPIADALAYIISDAGYMPLVASHGREALELARARHPALIITDLMMPQMSGADLIRALREDAGSDGLKSVPAVLMTAASGRVTRVPEADALLRKPFDIEEVEALLLRFLGPPDAP
jgi:two-component system, sensor histidine kinase and response regulator